MSDDHSRVDDTDHLDLPPAGSEPTGVEEPGSILAALRAEFQNATLNETEEFEIPPSPGLMLRCRYVATETIDAKAKKLAKVKDQGVLATFAACDVLYEACDEILVYGPGGKLHPLKWLLDPNADPDPDVGEYEPTRFGADACQILGWPTELAQSPRKMVLKLFKGNQHAVRRTAMEVSEWMDGVGSNTREDLRGE